MQCSSSLGDYLPSRVACIIILESSVNTTQFSHILGILVSVAQGKFGALATCHFGDKAHHLSGSNNHSMVKWC